MHSCAPNLVRLAVIAFFLGVAGCETAPVQEMSDARQAITVAREAGAEVHASADFEAAVGYLKSAEASLSRRDYASARRDALQAKETALSALERSEAARPNSP